MWWVYVCDRKKRTMVACPDRVTGLRDNQEVIVVCYGNNGEKIKKQVDVVLLLKTRRHAAS